METVITDTRALRITATPGDTDTAVVAFSGVGFQLEQIPQEEFVTTLQGATHSRFFVVDKRRSWYNATASDIIAILTPYLARYRKVVTLGNSMGGFGAVYFASRLPNVRSAISFSPQFSVDAALVPCETRWDAYRSRITSWTVRHAMEQVSGKPEILLFFGAEEREDDEHRVLFEQYATDQTAIVSLAEAHHGTARYFKRNDLLTRLLDAIIVDEVGATGMTDLLARSQVPYTLWMRSVAAQ